MALGKLLRAIVGSGGEKSKQVEGEAFDGEVREQSFIRADTHATRERRKLRARQG